MVMAVSDLQMFVDLNARTIPECSLMDLDMNNCARQSGWFDAFDVGRNSFISAEELHRVLAGFGCKKSLAGGLLVHHPMRRRTW